MRLQGDQVLQYLSGQPIMIEACNVFITQPTIKQIAMIGETSFLSMVQTFGNCEKIINPIKEVNPELSTVPDFHLLLIILSEDDDGRVAADRFLSLIFPNYDLEITENDIRFKLKDSDDIIGMINPMNFVEFKQTILNLFSVGDGKDDKPEYNPGDETARRLAEQIKEGRRRVAQAKAAQSGDFGSLYGNYISALSVGLGIDMNILFDYTPFQLHDAYNRYFAKVSSDFYQKVATTPLMDVSKMDRPKEWTRNLYV